MHVSLLTWIMHLVRPFRDNWLILCLFKIPTWHSWNLSQQWTRQEAGVCLLLRFLQCFPSWDSVLIYSPQSKLYIMNSTPSKNLWNKLWWDNHFIVTASADKERKNIGNTVSELPLNFSLPAIRKSPFRGGSSELIAIRLFLTVL